MRTGDGRSGRKRREKKGTDIRQGEMYGWDRR